MAGRNIRDKGRRRWSDKCRCSGLIWERAARRAASEAGLDATKFLAGQDGRRYVSARWQLWAKLSSRFTYSSIGKASGFDHASVRHGVLQLERDRAPYSISGRGRQPSRP